MDIVNEKKQLRTQIKLKVSTLAGDYIDYSNIKIFEHIMNLSAYQKAETIFCFIGRKDEIDTSPIIKDALNNGKTVCIPKCVAKGIMEARRYTSMDNLQRSSFGVLEPDDNSKLILPNEIDFAIIPCVTCNTKGHRLGFGGGYYDRYLLQADFFTCLICRHKLLYENIPLEKHDIMVKAVVTENGIFLPSKNI